MAISMNVQITRKTKRPFFLAVLVLLMFVAAPTVTQAASKGIKELGSGKIYATTLSGEATHTVQYVSGFIDETDERGRVHSEFNFTITIDGEAKFPLTLMMSPLVMVE